MSVGGGEASTAAAGIPARGPSAVSPGPPTGPDRRLLLPAAAGWVAAHWATGRSGPVVVLAVGLLGVPAALAGAVLALRLRRGRRIPAPVTAAVLVLAAMTTLLALTAFRLAERAAGPVPGWVGQQATVELEGQALSDAAPIAEGRFPGPARVAVRLEVRQVTGRGRRVMASLPMLVMAPAGSGPGAWAAVSAGQRVRLQGRLAPTSAGDDVVALVTARQAPLEIRPGSWPWRSADRIRAGLRDACDGLGADSRGLLPSLVVGDTTRLPATLRDDLQGAGLTHLTAVSGANVAILIGAVAWIAAAAGASRRSRIAVSAFAVAGFVVLARPSPSVLRAAVMASVALFGLAAGRRPRGFPVLAAAVLLLLGIDPWLARSPGFALSVTATAGLLLLAPPWADRLARRMPRPLAVALAAPAAAQAACGPVLVLLAPSVCPVALPANLLTEPAVAPATLLGAATAGVSVVWPWGAGRLAALAGLATDWISLVAHRAAAVPGGNLPWLGGPAGALALAAVTGLFVFVTVRHPRRDSDPTQDGAPPDICGRTAPRDRSGASRSCGADRRGRSAGNEGWESEGQRSEGGRRGWESEGRRREVRRREVRRRWSPGRRRLVAVLVLGAVLAGGLGLPLAGLRLPGSGVPDGWQLVLCDVGQGDALVVRSGIDRAVLVDAGPEPDAVDDCLRRLRIRHLDLVVVTHLHADHVRGLPGALRGRDVSEVLVSPLEQPPGTAEALRRWSEPAGAVPRAAWAGDRGECGRDAWAVTWRVLEPLLPPVVTGDVTAADGSAVNESSVALLLQTRGPAGPVRLLDLADLETGRQQGLADRLRTGAETLGGPVDLVKVAHHGSARQSPELYAASGARLALVGVGADNDYGHPAPSTLAMLAARGIRVLRTDLQGDLVVLADAGTIRAGGRS
ncbi:MAG TPA: ComEC/Rec2 family competence protein [Kineosporiaceae bacterium]|nr:ComEC/Rec2 family competence protein [Kineosporiaceae bacterium]